MGYMHIDNLYKARDILMFRECYALEKIHGTSAHVRWKNGNLGFFSGGAKHATFIELFDHQRLSDALRATGADPVVVYGEAYGGKMQGMSDTYGKKLRFVAFEVRINYCWLSVPQAAQFVADIGLEFVPWHGIPATVEAIDGELAKPSEQAVRNGVIEPRVREGIVLRPPIELMKNNGSRIIAKHKTEGFRETKTARKLDAGQIKVLEDAKAIADEWVTQMRLTHVIDNLGGDVGVERMGELIKAMLADIEREAAGEIVMSKPAHCAIGKATALMFKKRLKDSLSE